MLPERLSTDLCSLNENQERSCIAVRMKINSIGEKIEHNKNMFHVKQENFTINSTDIRHIDVITVR